MITLNLIKNKISKTFGLVQITSHQENFWLAIGLALQAVAMLTKGKSLTPFLRF